jgi:hypothetical protein
MIRLEAQALRIISGPLKFQSLWALSRAERRIVLGWYVLYRNYWYDGQRWLRMESLGTINLNMAERSLIRWIEPRLTPPHLAYMSHLQGSSLFQKQLRGLV